MWYFINWNRQKSDSSLESSFYEYQRTFPWQSYNLECNSSFALCEKPCGDHYWSLGLNFMICKMAGLNRYKVLCIYGN